jgi:hypothetical protein
LCVAVAAAALIIGGAGGCQSPQQKAQARAEQQAAAQRKEQERQRQAQAKSAQLQAEAKARAEQQRIADERKRAEEYARAEQQRLAQQRALAEQQARAERDKAAAQAQVDAQRAAQQQQTEHDRAAAQARLDEQNAAAAAQANRERAEAEAAAQKRQAALARGKKVKPEKVKPYPDDEKWVIGDPYIRPENHTRLFDLHMQSMAAAGAAYDSSLHDQHFDGTELNALGRSKVALMLQGAPKNEPLTIYVPPTGPTERVQSRLASVNRFWRDSQWAAMQVQTKQGVNPETAASAAEGLAGLRRLEQQDEEGGTITGGTGQSGDTVGTGGRTTD